MFRNTFALRKARVYASRPSKKRSLGLVSLIFPGELEAVLYAPHVASS